MGYLKEWAMNNNTGSSYTNYEVPWPFWAIFEILSKETHLSNPNWTPQFAFHLGMMSENLRYEYFKFMSKCN